MSVGWLVVGGGIIFGVVAVAYELAYSGMILPRVTVAGVDVSNTSLTGAKNRLAAEFAAKPTRVELVYGGKTLSNINFSYDLDLDWAVAQAYTVGRSGNILTRISERAEVFFRPRTINMPIKYDQDEMDGLLARIVNQVNRESKSAKLVYDKQTETIKLVPGEDGLSVNEEELKRKIIKVLGLAGKQEVEVPTEVESQAIDNEKVNAVMAAANAWKGKVLRIRYRDYSTDLTIEKILGLFNLSGEELNEAELKQLVAKVKTAVETEVRDATFIFEGGRVTEFTPDRPGVRVDEEKFREKLALNLLSVKTDLEIPVFITEPKIRTGDINNLGIKQLIGVGTSRFHNSIPNRIHNLTLASKKINGVLVAPGETFSLGKAIGDVSKATGFLEAYVISQGRTVLGDGGGVCQVSTTLFRAIMNAGLPVVERKAHAYRVHYYEEDLGPGYDATVFFPSADLKFTNDTPGYILIQTKVDTKNFSMRYELYGTGDGRVAYVSPAKIYGQTPPLATIYQDDPTMPKGTTKQVDWSAWGAKVSFDYKVTRKGETLIDKTFFSNYQPWAAIYLVGTAEN